MTRRTLIAGILYVTVMVGLGIVAIWPIYESLAAVWVALAGSVVGGVGAYVSVRMRWPHWFTAIALFVGWAAAGLGLAVPARWASGTPFPGALLDLLTGPVTGWKDLATSPLPVGEYRNLLVPLLTIFVVCVFFALRLSWRGGGMAAVAVPVAAALPFFGLFFGRTSTSSPLVIGDLRLHAPVEIATGAAALLVSIIWLAWRARDERRAALRRAEAATGIHSNRVAAPGAAFRRSALAAGMVALALVVGTAVSPAIADNRTREVLRSALGPDLSQTITVSPLAQYRASFTDQTFDEPLFSVTADGDLPERIRIATLTVYDGEVYRAAGAADHAFQRVPARLATPEGELSTVSFRIEGLRGVWLPTFGALSEIDFAGPDATALADGFYYNEATGTAVEAGGIGEGDAYEVRGVTVSQPDLATVPSPGARAAIAPGPYLESWLAENEAPRSGAGLVETIQKLRDRGYLSHALSEPETASRWMEALGDGYAFRASTAGHSLARVDQLFRQLLERQSQAETEGPDASLVAAVGDDEQFAVAGAVIAQQFGFPSRVVLGLRTADPELPSCDAGVCTAGDLSAWTEVRTDDGVWVAIDTTPQHTDGVNNESRRERDPENPTDVRPNTADEVTPPDPQRQEASDLPPQDEPDTDLSAFWAIARIVGISLLGLVILLAPFLVILIAKLVRRRGRRRDADPARAIAGGWEEYVDTAVDTGLPAPTVQTRQELAVLYATPAAGTLASVADHAVFSGSTLEESESERFWEIVSEERAALRGEIGWWQRVRAALSLKSFTRQLAARNRPGASPTTRASERRKRRLGDA